MHLVLLQSTLPPPQDMVIGYARRLANAQYFRIQDTFTFLHSMPLPDFVFGGKDDISDAIGMETREGVTLLKFRRPVRIGDPGDYCLLPGMKFRTVYGLGQVWRFTFGKKRG